VPDGDFRRPPLLWEQKLAQLVSMTSVGVVSGGGTDPNTPDLPPGDGGPGVEPEPVLPAPVDFIAPSTPTLTGTVQGLRVSWDGLNSAGNRYPSDVYVEVHFSTSGATFTPSSSTLAGTLLGSAGFFTIMGLSAGTTYFVRLVGVDAKGNRTSPSTAASGQTGLTTSSDYGTATITSGAVSFNARQIGGITTTVGATAPGSPVTGDIWLDSSGGAIVHKRWNGSSWVTQAWGSDSISAGAVTAVQIAAGAITAGAIAANAITADKINAGAVTADKIGASAVTADKIAANAITANKISAGAIDGQTISGASIRTGSSGARVEIGSGFGVLSAVAFFNSAGSCGSIGSGLGSGELLLAPGSGGTIYLNGITFINNNLDVNGLVESDQLKVTGANVDFTGVTTGATTADAGFNGDRLRKKTSNQKYKYDIAAVDGTFEDVDEARQVDVVTVDPADVLTLAVAEYSWLEDGEPTEWRELGFIAQDVAAKFPIAASINEDGEAIAVRDTPLIAALLAVVKQQQQQITDLTARIEALEA
jgi:hypothetical protein